MNILVRALFEIISREIKEGAMYSLPEPDPPRRSSRGSRSHRRRRSCCGSCNW
jgi:hypothetical protein